MKSGLVAAFAALVFLPASASALELSDLFPISEPIVIKLAAGEQIICDGEVTVKWLEGGGFVFALDGEVLADEYCAEPITHLPMSF
jgi:hypothetical protein